MVTRPAAHGLGNGQGHLGGLVALRERHLPHTCLQQPLLRSHAHLL